MYIDIDRWLVVCYAATIISVHHRVLEYETPVRMIRPVQVEGGSP